jgi:hypothetical protein
MDHKIKIGDIIRKLSNNHYGIVVDFDSVGDNKYVQIEWFRSQKPTRSWIVFIHKTFEQKLQKMS